ncbi:MAG: hypothetical protein WCQ95_01200 [Bacteroidota bacterium]
MRNLFLSGFLILFFISIVTAQNEIFEKKVCVPISANRIVTDNFGNIYVVEKSNLKEYNTEGTLLYSYSEFGDGKISGIDVSDPLKIIIFNADFGKIKFLDNNLTQKNNSISLNDLGYPNASLVSASYDSGFWIFDPLSNQVIRFDKTLQPTQTSGNIIDLIGYEFSPNFITEWDNTLYLNDPRVGILLFDRYATYLKTIPIKNLKTFQVFNNMIVYLENNFLISLNLKTFEENKLKLPFSNEEIINATIDNQRVYFITKTKFCIYKFL